MGGKELDKWDRLGGGKLIRISNFGAIFLDDEKEMHQSNIMVKRVV
jgi:hypothetical protein